MNNFFISKDDPFIYYTQILQRNPHITSNTLQVRVIFFILFFISNLTNDDYIDHDLDITTREGDIMEGVDGEHMAYSMIQCSLE